MTAYDLNIHALYSQLTDQQLDGIVRDIQTRFSTCGNQQTQPMPPPNLFSPQSRRGHHVFNND